MIRNYLSTLLSTLIILLCISGSPLHAKKSSGEQHELLLAKALQDTATPITTKKSQNAKRNITFSYQDELIIDIINELAALKKVNVVMPIKEDPIRIIKVTLNIPEKITLEQAWHLLATILDNAGYSLIQQGEWYEIVKNSKDIATEPLPLYIGVPPESLPNDAMRIRYIYYLANLKITPTAMTEKLNNELYAILNTLLPENKDNKTTPSFYLDSQTNSIIISDKAENIKSAMKIITYLDKIELQEKLEVLKLRYLSADVITDIFKQVQLKDQAQQNRFPLDARSTEAAYFSQNVKIMPYKRMNAIMVLGKKQDIDRVRDFIYKYLDVPMETGQSVLHVYQLQYLDAFSFAQTLTKIVNSQTAETTGQAAGAAKKVEGVERYFEEVIIKADLPKAQELLSASTAESTKENPTDFGSYAGGNKLIIACRHDDWVRIKKLIEELDVPQRQVIIEVMIAELTAAETKVLGSMLRNPGCLPLPSSLAFQSAQLSGVITNPNPSGTLPTPPDSLTISNVDLGNVRKFGGTSSNFLSIPAQAANGTAAMTFNDSNGRTWGLLEVLDFIDVNNIVSNPHVIAINNVKTEIFAEQSRLVPDAPVGLQAGATQITRKWIRAPITVNVTPRISSAEMVNLDLQIQIARFGQNATAIEAANGENLGILNRRIVTNANVRSGDILALGGLSRLDDTASRTQVPILGSIPIIGYFFKNRANIEAKTNLTVFICPTIIEPRLRAGISQYTKDYVQISKEYATTGLLFESLRDPISRWFFRDFETNPISDIDNFVAEDEIRAREFDPVLGPQPQRAQAEQLLDELTRVKPSNPNDLLTSLAANTVTPASIDAPAQVAEKQLASKSSSILQQKSMPASSAPALSKTDMLAQQIKDLYKDFPTPATTA